MYICRSLCKSARYSCQILINLEFFRRVCENKNYENLSSGTDGQTDMTKLLVAFHNFANAPKNCAEWEMFSRYLFAVSI